MSDAPPARRTKALVNRASHTPASSLPSEQLRLALEAGHAFRPLRHLLGEDLDRDLSFELRVLGLIHLPILPFPRGAGISNPPSRVPASRGIRPFCDECRDSTWSSGERRRAHSIVRVLCANSVPPHPLEPRLPGRPSLTSQGLSGLSGWSWQRKRAHNPKVGGSNPPPRYHPHTTTSHRLTRATARWSFSLIAASVQIVRVLSVFSHATSSFGRRSGAHRRDLPLQ